MGAIRQPVITDSQKRVRKFMGIGGMLGYLGIEQVNFKKPAWPLAEQALLSRYKELIHFFQIVAPS